jgi:hypothetical protein
LTGGRGWIRTDGKPIADTAAHFAMGQLCTEQDRHRDDNVQQRVGQDEQLQRRHRQVGLRLLPVLAGRVLRNDHLRPDYLHGVYCLQQ